MKALVLNQSRDRVSHLWVERWLGELARLLARRGHRGLGRKEVVVVFVDGPEMKRLNHQYRGKDYATDILSFESAEEDVVGELVLCLTTINAQSMRTGLSKRGELGYMLVHGVLHLLGYEHEGGGPAEAEMFALQDSLYARLAERVGLR